MKPIYNWRNNFHKSDAQPVGEAMEKIREAHGATAEALVEAASEAESPLHPFFTWEDKECGRKWRLHEARNLWRMIEVTYPGTDKPEVMYTLVRREDGPSQYQPTRVVVSQPDLFEQAWRDASNSVGVAVHRLRELERIAREQGRPEVGGLRKVVNAITKTKETLDAQGSHAAAQS